MAAEKWLGIGAIVEINPFWNQQGTFWLCFLYKGILNKI